MLMLAMIGTLAVVGAFVALDGDDDDSNEDNTPDNIETGTEGRDLLDGTEGRDLITLGEGDDRSLGGDGDDTIHGDGGADELRGQLGDDDLYGGDGTDDLYGGAGDDFLSGGADADILEGGAGNDQMTGGGGIDVLRGGEGNDSMNGSLGQDLLTGDAGNDSLSGGFGSDGLYGGTGADTLDGGAGDDLLNGGDMVIDPADSSSITLRQMFLEGDAPSQLDLAIEDDGESDVLTGGDGDDTLIGGAGDILTGGSGVDEYLLGDWMDAGEAAIIRDFDVEEEVVLYSYTGSTPDLDYNTVVNSDGTSDVEVTVNGEVIAYLEDAADGFDLASNVRLISA